MTVSSETLTAGSSATVTKTIDSTTGIVNLDFGIPQGIKGESLEDHIESLIASANYDLQIASRGIVLLDEFDKLGVLSFIGCDVLKNSYIRLRYKVVS